MLSKMAMATPDNLNSLIATFTSLSISDEPNEDTEPAFSDSLSDFGDREDDETDRN